ncbi:branched-chain amino acid transport system II carrier protein [Bacillus pumilus]|uniref:branched-chain amino acid transport system II carrier protein n=1 Tax=Bacillus pumilus TaxID=1408 RepID=UPI00017A6A1A|nr:branched-chain amino acid transport system II carrier protein [Bacillus pumilus]EDW20697.1 branched-chain amino acid transport system II carrier protein [Bacillus pumilus ATCC 7061]MCR4353170.1 branched-chain amino acid transport system II carrier protein [Bacillus pumilus]MCY7506627.1 branched-chain amino acid transport system II carrier protein [Bacillus pumilus]MDR4269244.1 branched-chain amino acid transport system II carrier protein [Bacillus pumilus]MED4631159.1 branched-chain amino a
MKNSLSIKETLAIGLMLFALFFGAGNMIFPPVLGQYAGENVWLAIGGFLLTGVGLPLLGVIAIALTGTGAKGLADKAHPIFGTIFTVILYLSIGPFFAIPRTGTVSYEIGLAPFLSETQTSSWVPLFLFTLVFFTITYLLALNPSKLVDRIGKVLTPILLTVIAIIVFKAIATPMGIIGAPDATYKANPLFTGFLEGYKTMDALASLVFGIVVVTAVKERGITERKSLAAACIKAGLVAAAGLALVYISLAYVGASSPDTTGMVGANEGGKLLSLSANFLFGSAGNIVLGVAILFACLTTSVGLVSSCGEYFSKLFPALSYRTVVLIVSLFSTLVANLGLAQIISLSVPVLVAIYPLAIVIILLSFLDRWINGRRVIYVVSLIFTGFFAIIDGLLAAKINLGGLPAFSDAFIPFYDLGIGWVVPAIIGAGIGVLISMLTSPPKQLAS